MLHRTPYLRYLEASATVETLSSTHPAWTPNARRTLSSA
jgi:hypothetical protein